VLAGDGSDQPLAFWASTCALTTAPTASENGTFVSVAIGTVQARAATMPAAEPSHAGTISVKVPSAWANLTRYAVTAAPRSLVGAGQVTSTSRPSLAVLGAAGASGVAEA
jgi:hypothetical protein